MGTIEGTVTDEERVPIPNASVALVKLKLEVLADAQGRFRFENVPVGTHTVSAYRLGYDALAKHVEVRSGETAKLELVLEALAVAVGYFNSVPHNSVHIIGETYLTWAVNLTGAVSTCEGCVWVDRTPKPPSYIVFEIFGRHTVTNPQGDAEHFWIFRDHYSTGQILLEQAAPKLPVKATLNATQISKTKVFWTQLLCENLWFCFQEKRESWTTFFFDYREEDVPENFTAKKT